MNKSITFSEFKDNYKSIYRDFSQICREHKWDIKSFDYSAIIDRTLNLKENKTQIKKKFLITDKEKQINDFENYKDKFQIISNKRTLRKFLKFYKKSYHYHFKILKKSISKEVRRFLEDISIKGYKDKSFLYISQ